MQIRMVTTQPKPGTKRPCYIAGKTYTLASPDELKMAEAFIANGAAELLSPPAATTKASKAVSVAEAQETKATTEKAHDGPAVGHDEATGTGAETPPA